MLKSKQRQLRYVVALLIVQMDTLCTCIVKSVMVSHFIALKESIHSNDVFAIMQQLWIFIPGEKKQIYLIELNSEAKGQMNFHIDNVMILYFCIDILLCEHWWQPEGTQMNGIMSSCV